MIIQVPIQRPPRAHAAIVAAPPRYLSGEARQLTKAMLAAEASLKPVSLRIDSDEGRILVYWSHGKLREEKRGSVWTYDPKTLTVSCPKGYFRGHASHADCLDYLAALVGGADTVSRQLLTRQGLFRDFLTSDETLRIVGKEMIGGQPADILSIEGKAVRASLYIRHADHLVIAVDSDSLDPAGRTLVHEHRSFAYRFVPTPATSLFTIEPRSGAKIQALPKSAIRLRQRGLGLKR